MRELFVAIECEANYTLLREHWKKSSWEPREDVSEEEIRALAYQVMDAQEEMDRDILRELGVYASESYLR